MKLKHLVSLSALAASLTIMTSTPVYANKVTGFFDSSAQINAILSSPVVARALQNQAIMSLDSMGLRPTDLARLWRIGTESCDLRIALLPVPRQESGSLKGITYRVEEPVKVCE